MNHGDECGWAVGGTEWHDIVGPFDCIGTLECELLLCFWRDRDLMVSHRRVVQPNPTAAKRFFNRHITTGDGVRDQASDLI